MNCNTRRKMDNVSSKDNVMAFLERQLQSEKARCAFLERTLQNDITYFLKKYKSLYYEIFSQKIKTSSGYGYSIIDMIFGIPPIGENQFEIFVTILEEINQYLETIKIGKMEVY